nr:hypothetical protein [Tanacetum cinerariifolium]
MLVRKGDLKVCKDRKVFLDEVQNKVKAKQTRFRELISMKDGEANKSVAEERYKEAKREAKKLVARVKGKAYEDLYKILDSKEGENDIYMIAKSKKRRKIDIRFVRFIKDEDGRSIVNEDYKCKPTNNCYSPRIRHTKVKKALQKIGRNKVVGPDEILIKAWKCLGGERVRWLTLLFNMTFLRAKMPEEWRRGEALLASRTFLLVVRLFLFPYFAFWYMYSRVFPSFMLVCFYYMLYSFVICFILSLAVVLVCLHAPLFACRYVPILCLLVCLLALCWYAFLLYAMFLDALSLAGGLSGSNPSILGKESDCLHLTSPYLAHAGLGTVVVLK